MPRHCLLIANPAAGGGRARRLLADSLRSGAWPDPRPEVIWTRGPGEAREIARVAARDGGLVVAAGGDGTVREVASGLVSAGPAAATLGVLPIGTGNDFAVQAGIPGPREAVAALWGAAERRFDVIEVSWKGEHGSVTEHALLFAAVGFAVDLLRFTGPAVKRWFGRRLGYSVGFLRALGAFRSQRLSVRSEGHRFDGVFLHVCAGNSEWAGGGAMRLSPGACMDDGWLQMCVIQAVGRWGVLRRFPLLLRGSFPGHPQVRFFPGKRLEVVAEPPGPLALDGDVVGRTPAEFRVLPAVLRVRVPGSVASRRPR